MKTMRPVVFPKNIFKKAIYIAALIILSIAFIYGITLDRLVCIILGSPSIPMWIYLMYRAYVRYATRVDLLEKEIRCTNEDFVSSVSILDEKKASMNYENIHYIYFAEKEMKTCIYIKNRVKKVKVIKNENNFTPQTLIEKYNIPKSYISKLMSTEGIVFDENNLSAFIEILDELREKYNISIYKMNDIQNEIKQGNSITFDYITNVFTEDKLRKVDILNLKKFFTNNEDGLLLPLCSSKFNIDKYEKLEKSIFESKHDVDWTLVLSNEDGTSKAYITHFYSFSLKDRKEILQSLLAKTSARVILNKEILLEHDLSRKV
ncbi:MAG: hypothetical protein RR751_06390 [Clostridia bacterium]